MQRASAVDVRTETNNGRDCSIVEKLEQPRIALCLHADSFVMATSREELRHSFDQKRHIVI
jgi:hypothetical protein